MDLVERDELAFEVRYMSSVRGVDVRLVVYGRELRFGAVCHIACLVRYLYAVVEREYL